MWIRGKSVLGRSKIMDKSKEAGKDLVNSGTLKCFTMVGKIESCAGCGRGCTEMSRTLIQKTLCAMPVGTSFCKQ